MPLHDRDVDTAGEVVVMAEVDVPGPAERREPQPDPAEPQLVRQPRLTKSMDTGTPWSSKRSRIWFSTQ
jgi:hypothetical protein